MNSFGLFALLTDTASKEKEKPPSDGSCIGVGLNVVDVGVDVLDVFSLV